MTPIVLFVPRFHTNLRHWVEGLRHTGFAPQVWTLYAGQSERYDGVVPRQIGYSRLWRALAPGRGRDAYDPLSMRWGLPSLRQLWRAQRTGPRPAVVMIRNVNSTSALLVLALALLRWRGRIVLYSLGPKYRPTLGLRRRLLYALTTRALPAVWLTPVRGERSATATHPGVHYVPFGHPARVEAAAVWARRCAPPRALVVGKLIPRKNHGPFLQVLAAVRRAIDVRALVVGEASRPAQREHHHGLCELARRLGLGDAVEFRLNVPVDAMSDVYRAADLLVLPATAERGGMVVLEAMAFGLPVICSSTCGLAGYIEPGVSGDVFRDGDWRHLAAVLAAWCGDAERLRRGGLAALELCRTRHAPERLGEFLRDVVLGSGDERPGGARATSSPGRGVAV